MAFGRSLDCCLADARLAAVFKGWWSIDLYVVV